MKEAAQPINQKLPEVSPHRFLQAILRLNLGAFIERSFAELVSGQSYEHNWHMDALAWHLSEVAAGRQKRLLITLPPRSLKSISTSVAFPAWLLGHQPDRRIVCVSYASDLATEHANGFRALIKSGWYQELFPSMRIDPKKDTETEVKTTQRGYRLTTTIGGSLTGRGGSVVIIDDPLKASDANSEVARKKANAWFEETLLSRLDDKRNDAVVIAMQRLHVDDLARRVLKSGGWSHLNLPAISEHEERIQTGPDKYYVRAAHEILHPREPLEALNRLKAEMGSASFSAQYQQQPVPLGGNMIRWKWFAVDEGAPDQGRRSEIVQSWDTASKGGELNDYSVGITAQITGEQVRILDVFRERLDYPYLKRAIVQHKERWDADTVLIEDKGSGTSLIQDLNNDYIYPIAIMPEGDKVVRMSGCSAKIEAGSVSLPSHAAWLDEFQSELLAFPHGSHDDQADALSQLLNWMRDDSGYTLDNL